MEQSNIDANVILDSPAPSKHRDGRQRTYRELIEKKVRIREVIHIQRKWDPDDVSYKWCDFSERTIFKLIKNGFQETLERLSSFTTGTKPSLLQSMLSEIEKDRTDSELDERERLTEKQASWMTSAIQKQISIS